MQRYIITVDFWHQQNPLIVLITIKCAGKHTCSFAPAAVSSRLSRWCWTSQINYTSDTEKHQIPHGSGARKKKILARLILLDDSGVNIFSSLSGWINILYFVGIQLFAIKMSCATSCFKHSWTSVCCRNSANSFMFSTALGLNHVFIVTVEYIKPDFLAVYHKQPVFVLILWNIN